MPSSFSASSRACIFASGGGTSTGFVEGGSERYYLLKAEDGTPLPSASATLRLERKAAKSDSGLRHTTLRSLPAPLLFERNFLAPLQFGRGAVANTPPPLSLPSPPSAPWSTFGLVADWTQSTVSMHWWHLGHWWHCEALVGCRMHVFRTNVSAFCRRG